MAKLNPEIAGDTLINPFIHFDKGVCPKCNGRVFVLEKETSAFALSPKGEPISHKTLYAVQTAYCPKCTMWFGVVKNGMNFEVVSDIEIRESMNSCLGIDNTIEDKDDICFEPLFGHF